MKKLVVLFVVFIMILSGCAPAPDSISPSPSPSPTVTPSVSPSPSPTPAIPPTTPPSPAVLTVADFFPFTPNVHMSYVGSGNEYAGFESYVDYINNGAIQLRTNNTGTESVNVYKIDSGALKKVFMQGETYYMYDYTAMNTMSDVLIMDPIAVGTTWTLASGDQRAITSTNATVTVPYGTFTALEVTTTYADSIMKEYYVEDLGLVKREFTANSDPTNPITSELQAVTNGPYTLNMRFYYPDFNNDQIVYVDQSIQYNTNDTMTSVLENEFKNVPSGSGLTPLMSAATAINSLTFDTSTYVVTVDFSEEFITQMNAGTSLEGMILESVGDTLGSYFQTNQVQILIDGGAYMSGHFGFNLGDYLPYNPSVAVEYTP